MAMDGEFGMAEPGSEMARCNAGSLLEAPDGGVDIAGDADRPLRSRSTIRSAWFSASNTPLSRHVANQRQAVLLGGRSLGRSRQATPPRITWKTASTISRKDHERGPPIRFGGGGSTRRHSASVKSVSWRSPARPCCRRVAGARIARSKMG
jgi:hypothetical protein